MTLTLEDVAISNSWGYTRTGRCDNCRTNQELYVISIVHNCGELCVNCMINSLNELRRYGSFINEPAVDHITQHRPIPDPDTPTCYSCGGVSDGVSDLMATINPQGEEVWVHDDSNCSRSCERCDTQYPRYNWRVGNFYAASITFDNFERYFNQDCCRLCREEHIAEYEDLFHCSACDSFEVRDDSGYFNGTRYCENCLDNYVYSCDECGDQYWDGDGHDCTPDEHESYLIHSYSYKPRPYFFGMANYHMGFELEVEADGNSRHAGAEVVVNALGERVYLKEDGSLSDGFEIVTHPHTLDEYRTNFDWEALNSLRRMGFRSWNTHTCGLHVHVSRTAFGHARKRSDLVKIQAHELRFMKLIYDNDRQISRLAGRTSSYATFDDKGHLVSKIKYGNQENGRYSAINSQNSETLEVRVFRGSLKPQRVLMALELIQCAVEYTRDLRVSAKNKALSWMMFTRYVADNAETYPNLFNAMEKSFMSDSVQEN